jgi:hypothetical protein
MAKEKPSGLTTHAIKEKGWLLFEAVVGSQAYGTATPQSDTDIKGVFVMPGEVELMLDFDPSWETVADKTGEGPEKIETEYFSLRKFMRMLTATNPMSLEMLYSPADCILYKHPFFDDILEHRSRFLNRRCEKSFAEFALQQIRKAKGLNKKQNWSAERRQRQELLDFCFVAAGQGSKPIKEKLGELSGGTMRGRESDAASKCGLVRIPHMREVYGVYYDPSEELGYKGILSRDGNNLSLSSIPKGETPVFHMQFNTDAWATHCKEYREYQQWETTCNKDRWVDVQGHGQMIDGKNMMHCVRLIETATEIATDLAVNVRRPDAESLLGIKKGRVPLQQILHESAAKIERLPEVFASSALPEEIGAEALAWADAKHHDITVAIRSRQRW